VISEIFNTILYRPLFNALIFLYQVLPGSDFGLAIITLTIFVRLLLLPFSIQSLKSQKTFSELQEKVQEIQRKYKEDKERQTKEIIKLYQTEKINPFSNLFSLFLQFLILIALYKVFLKGFQNQELTLLYSFIPKPREINPFFLGFLDLSKPNLFLAILVGVFQFFQTKISIPLQKNKKKQKSQFSEIFQKQTLYLFPIVSFLIFSHLPAALTVYFITFLSFSIIQQFLFLKQRYDPKRRFREDKKSC